LNAAQGSQGENMADRLKRVLVESFIGAIALGYVLAEVVFYFVNIFTSPFSAWATGSLYRAIAPGTAASSASYLRAAVSPAVAFVLLLLVWYLILRWLYFTPFKKEEPDLAKS
jgi:hypothetical protein